MRQDELIFVIAILLFESFFFYGNADAFTDPNRFVRTANYYLRSGPAVTDSVAAKLASYDLLILPMETQVYNPGLIPYLRSKNPDIIILPYIPSRSINILDINDGAQIRKRLKNGIRDEWYLHAGNGETVSAWPGTVPLDVTSPWNEYLPQFVFQTLWRTKLWDGIFYDEVQDEITYLNSGDIRLNGNAGAQNKDEINKQWREGTRKILEKTRELLGPDAIIITNGSSNPQYRPFVNGRMFESFPTPWEGRGTWSDTMKLYLDKETHSPKNIFVINANTNNTGKYDDFKKVRFSLASTLLCDGYFGFDFGTRNHGQLLSYDEFDVSLGKPVGVASNLTRGSTNDAQPGVWRRDFHSGAVIVNATVKEQDIELDGEFEKIHGTQDSLHNDGSIISSLTLASQDGILLVRPLEALLNTTFQNGSFVRVVDLTGKTKRNGFFAYSPSQKGPVSLSLLPLTEGEVSVVSHNGALTAYNKNLLPFVSFKPFGEAYRGDLSFVVADMNNDGAHEIIVAKGNVVPKDSAKKNKKERKEPAEVKIFGLHTARETLSFRPFGSGVSAPVNLAVGNLDGVGDLEIIVSIAGQGGGMVRTFSSNGVLRSKGFFPYSQHLRTGVSVAAGDTDGDGRAEIITAGANEAVPVRVWNEWQSKPLFEFKPFSSGAKKGVSLAAQDVDNDGRAEVLLLTKDIFITSTVKKN